MTRPMIIAARITFGAFIAAGTVGLWVASVADTTRRNEEIAKRGRYDQWGLERRTNG